MGRLRVDRCAVFVDAGWFLSEAAQAVTGKGDRSSVQWDYAQLMTGLESLAREHMQLPLLRIYWYDAARDGAPGAEQLDVASLPNVKLRMSRSSHREQKGVDALLILDLTTLARERAIANALVISGDENVRDGIALAQSLGVHVTVGAAAAQDGRPTPAAGLRHEADDQLVVDFDSLNRCLHAGTPDDQAAAASAPLAAPVATTVPASVTAQVSQSPVTPPPAGSGAAVPEPRHGGVVVAAQPEEVTPREFGYNFGARHGDTLDSAELRMLQREAPMIPSDVAAQLFREGEEEFGPIRGKPEIRRELKAGYWDHIMRRR
jgi:uncharacterized LabA/DUF88 family protein